METQYQHVRIERVGKVAHLILNRPDILNAVHQAAAIEVEAAARLLAADPELRLIAIRGTGRAFCTGIDLKELAAGRRHPLTATDDLGHRQCPDPRIQIILI